MVFGARNDSLRLCSLDVGGRIVEPVEYFDPELIGILENDFVAHGIDSDGTVYWIRVPDQTHRRTSDIGRFDVTFRGGVSGSLTQRRKQI